MLVPLKGHLMKECDPLILGTGYFAEVMLNGIAAVARRPVRVVVGGATCRADAVAGHGG